MYYTLLSKTLLFDGLSFHRSTSVRIVTIAVPVQMAALRVPTNVEQSSIATLNILLASLLLCTLYGSNNDTLGGWHDIRSEEEGGTAMRGQIYCA